MTFKMGSKKSLTAIKICGITQIDQAKAIASLGVNAIGVIGVEESPRFVPEDQRRKLFNGLKDFSPYLKRVWVIADMSDSKIQTALDGHGTPSIVQLHGDETPKRCKELSKRYPHIEWWKAIKIRNALDISKAHEYEESIGALLLDAWSPTALGGTGNRIPLNWIKQETFKIPWWLAGGISAEWIPEIFSQVKPNGIDASSRLETIPGIKDLDRVSSLVKTIKAKTADYS